MFPDGPELTDEMLETLSLYINSEADLRKLAIIGLNIEEIVVANSVKNHPNEFSVAVGSVLKTWRVKKENDKLAYTELCEALKKAEMLYYIEKALQ